MIPRFCAGATVRVTGKLSSLVREVTANTVTIGCVTVVEVSEIETIGNPPVMDGKLKPGIFRRHQS